MICWFESAVMTLLYSRMSELLSEVLERLLNALLTSVITLQRSPWISQARALCDH